MNAKRPFIASCILLSALCIAIAEDLPNDQNVHLDLGGGTKSVRDWMWPGWNGFYLSVTNGTLSVTGKMHPRHGVTDIFAGGTLRFEEGSSYLPGMNDAQPRTTRVLRGGTLDLSHGALAPFHARFFMDEGSRVLLGCNLKSVPHGHRWRAKGGRLVVTDHVDFNMNEFFVDTNAVLEVEVAEGKIADMSSVTLAPGAELKETGKGILIRSHDDPRWAKCQTQRELDRLGIHARGDTANRCYCLYFPVAATAFIARVSYECPEFGTFSTRLPYFCVRYPADARGPFEIQADVEAWDGTRVRKTVAVPFDANPIGKPAPNDKIFLGMVAYGPGRERYEMITNDLANLYVRWNNIPQLMPENANNEISPNWMEAAEKHGIRSMLIYSHPSKEQIGRIRAAWGDRYLGNNCGERTGFLYGSPGQMRGPQDCATLTDAREWFLTGFFRGDRPPRPRGPMDDPFTFATSGAAFANYELPAGIDYVCSELYACGCQSLVYATAENRGAARKWGPEWWCGWLAHEWQTLPIVYQSDDKYLSLEAGIKSLYVMGTSLMCLESGSSGTQAHSYAWGVPEDHRKTGYRYDEDPPRRYRETIRKCHLFVKDHPRAKGTPETKIALALGCNDSYIGMPVTPWAQHGNRMSRTNEAVNVWSASAPENTWNCAREVFLPDSGTRGVNGMPYGQVDVVGVDEQSRLSDLSRYSLVVFGGWNTMTPRARDVLERWVENGGTCAMCLPQCSTRDDRDYANYGVDDLLVPFGLEVEGFEKSNGIEVARLAPNGLVEVERTVGDGGAPLVVGVKAGKGRFHLLLGKQFPAANGRLASAWKTLLADCGDKVEQSVRLAQADEGDPLRFFMAAAYDDCAYVMNLDMHEERKVVVRLDGTARELALAPLEVKSLPRRR